ncbi:ABC transporter permease [Thalassovita mediterranea]|uniref:Dipeptide transport system permease protein DppB n=1 Tax=Thalassovita mediterranea TaxID=340021 RepID=A0A0P1GNU6_9RHOB|nr:ABC transporter permease [Thalassovita mediterranea]MCG7573261.1 ABC transporter permease [Phaeobacter sp. CNT1-3]CUH84199.1 Dipeptide transport system permease protein DppB [Thalassovita mediterranea]SIS27580.1 peptide/nickel transport system permease protein [Thalassovita mediterranea]
MLSFVLRRLGQSSILILIMSILVFVGMYVVSDPVAVLAGEDFTEEDRIALAEELGVNRPLVVQYLSFLKNIAQGDFGTSFVYNRPVLDLILERLPATLEVAVLAIGIGLTIGIPLGIYSGLNQRKPATKAISFTTTVGYSIPNFWQALLLILCFSVWLKWLPASGRGDTTDLFGIPVSFLNWDGLSHMLLPAINLAIYKICMQARLSRSGTQEVMYQDYMTFARAKGIGRDRLIRRHLMRNILIPIVTITGLELGGLIAFSTVTETVFSWPGIGKLLLDSIHHADRPIVVAYLILITLMFVTINFIVDVLYALLDPRIRYK